MKIKTFVASNEKDLDTVVNQFEGDTAAGGGKVWATQTHVKVIGETRQQFAFIAVVFYTVTK